MSDNPGTEAAGQVSRVSAELQRILASLALPAQVQAAQGFTSSLGRPGELPPEVARVFGDARKQLNTDFADAETRGKATLAQAALQSGVKYSPSALSEAATGLGQTLDFAAARANRALDFREAQTGQDQTNFLLSQLTGISGNMLSGSLGFGQNALQSANTLSQLYQQRAGQGAAIGSAVGGIAGSYFGPVGTAAGAGLGGLLGGYFGGR